MVRSSLFSLSFVLALSLFSPFVFAQDASSEVSMDTTTNQGLVYDPLYVEQTLTLSANDCLNRMKLLGKDLSSYKRTKGTDGFFRFVVPSGYVFRCDVPLYPKSVMERLQSVKVNNPGMFAIGNKIAFSSGWLKAEDLNTFNMTNDWNDLPSSVNVVAFIGLSGISMVVEVREKAYDDYFLNKENSPLAAHDPLVSSEKEAWAVVRKALGSVFANGDISVSVKGLAN